MGHGCLRSNVNCWRVTGRSSRARGSARLRHAHRAGLCVVRRRAPGDARFCPACGTSVPELGGVSAGALPSSDSAAPAARAVWAEPPPAPRRSRVGSARSRRCSSPTWSASPASTSPHDPELVQALVTRAFDRLSPEVARYEGIVEKFAGDAMLAVFGVPAIHEDDAERAVRAALEMQAAMVELAAELRREGRPELSLRIGIETGEVLVDLGRASGERDRIVTGDAVNTAARLQQVAPPGDRRGRAGTYAATRERRRLRGAARRSSLKGKALPVAAWRAVAVKARRGASARRWASRRRSSAGTRRSRSSRRPCAGPSPRPAAPGDGRRQRRRRQAPPDLGAREVPRRPAGRRTTGARAVASRTRRPSYSAPGRRRSSADATILDDDAPDDAPAKLEARLAELGVRRSTPAIANALRGARWRSARPRSLARDELFDAWRRYLEALAPHGPLVLVLEDIHWADEGLLDFIESVARWARGPDGRPVPGPPRAARAPTGVGAAGCPTRRRSCSSRSMPTRTRSWSMACLRAACRPSCASAS